MEDRLERRGSDVVAKNRVGRERHEDRVRRHGSDTRHGDGHVLPRERSRGELIEKRGVGCPEPRIAVLEELPDATPGRAAVAISCVRDPGFGGYPSTILVTALDRRRGRERETYTLQGYSPVLGNRPPELRIGGPKVARSRRRTVARSRRRPGHAQVTPWSRPGRAQVRVGYR